MILKTWTDIGTNKIILRVKLIWQIDINSYITLLTMAIRNLIDGQTITIDNHNSGTEIEWGEGVHLHKRMNKDKYAGAEVLIYIGEDKELEFRSVIGGDEEKIRLQNEIRKAFKNVTIRKQFVESFYKSLRNILDASCVKDENERYKLAKQAATRIVRLFGLKEKMAEWFVNGVNEFFVFTQGENSDNTIVVLNAEEPSITIGRDMDYVSKVLL